METGAPLSILRDARAARSLLRMRGFVLLLHHGVGVAPDGLVDQALVFDRLLAGHDAAGLDRDGDHGVELGAVHAVVVRRPEADVEELLERAWRSPCCGRWERRRRRPGRRS